MEQIGGLAAQIVAKASQLTPSNALARPLDTSRPPTIDRFTDAELPGLICWIPADGSEVELARRLHDHERLALERRQRELSEALSPHADHERVAAKAAIAAMLGGFRSMRQQGEDAIAVAEITRAVLREFPLWAIKRACAMIATDNAGLDNRWPPNDAQIYATAREIVRYHRKALDTCEELLVAKITPPAARRPSKEEIEADLAALNLPMPPPADYGHMARVLADIQARKARPSALEAAE